MARTADKLILGILVAALIGMSGVMISAFSSSEAESRDSFGTVLLSEITPDEAKMITLDAIPGVVGKVEVEKENGEYYEVEVDDGIVVREVKVDFQGKILGISIEARAPSLAL